MPKRQRHQHHVPSIPKFKPLTDEQADAYELCCENHITFLTGPAGCSKSYTAIAFAVDCLLAGEAERIVLTRPAVEACGESLGYLPGTTTQKIGGYMTPLFENLHEYASSHIDAIRPQMEIAPLGFMRGRTIKNAVLVLDEAQNASFPQLKMLLTRIGKGASMILCGDAAQCDIGLSPLMDVAKRMSQISGIAHLHFTKTSGAIRHPLIPSILEAFEDLA
jgi:phosphate starvation-inducible PhoH-like protein